MTNLTIAKEWTKVVYVEVYIYVLCTYIRFVKYFTFMKQLIVNSNALTKLKDLKYIFYTWFFNK